MSFNVMLLVSVTSLTLTFPITPLKSKMARLTAMLNRRASTKLLA